LLARLVAVGQAGVRVRRLGGDRAGEMRITRFLRNEQVRPAEMVATAAARTKERVVGRHILAIQDTTSVRDDGRGASIVLHPTIAIDAVEGALLGLVHGEVLQRDGTLKSSAQRTFEEKQSFRWLAGARAAAELSAAGAACVTVIADREGDIYEEFALKPQDVELLIRAAQDRALADGKRLFSCTEGMEALGEMTVSLAAAPGRKAREARLALRVCPVVLARPKTRPARGPAALPQSVALTLVEARELTPPPGETAAHWRLQTTHAVAGLSDAKRLVGFYRERWTIEQLFRTMKTQGFDIERSRVADEPFANLATATLMAAIEVLQLVRERDGTAARPLEDVFDAEDQPALEQVCATLEGKTQRQKNPHPKGSLAYASWVCARLGGWTGYYGKPGPIVILAGLLRFRAIVHGWKLGRLL
jgi:hypothetical protein